MDGVEHSSWVCIRRRQFVSLRWARKKTQQQALHKSHLTFQRLRHFHITVYNIFCIWTMKCMPNNQTVSVYSCIYSFITHVQHCNNHFPCETGLAYSRLIIFSHLFWSCFLHVWWQKWHVACKYATYWHSPHSKAQQSLWSCFASICLSHPAATCLCCGSAGKEISIDCCTTGRPAVSSKYVSEVVCGRWIQACQLV